MTLNTQVNPTIHDAADMLTRAFRARDFVLLVGRCTVDYEGRAASTLTVGERVVIVKQDGSVLVHRPLGYEPVNWQPPKCLLKTWADDSGALTVYASRSQPKENVSIEFTEITLAATGKLHDSGEFALHVTEQQMKEAILAAPDLVEEGLRPLQEEKALGDAGFTDVYGEDAGGHLVVIEIKRNPATRDAVAQLQRYLDKIKKRVDRPLRGIIAAPELRKSAQPLLESFRLEYVKLAPEKCFTVLKSRKDMKLSSFLT